MHGIYIINMESLFLYPGTLRQSTFDKVGFGKQYQSVTLTTGNYTVDTPIQFNSGTVLTSEKNAILTLRENVNPNVFKPQIPIFGQKTTSIADIIVENVIFNGNSDRQEATPTWPGKAQRTGQGYHNFVGFQNAKNIEIRDIEIYNTLGDGARIKNGNDIRFNSNKVNKCGHDGLYVDGGSNVDACNNSVGLRTNSAVRLRHVHHARVTDNYIQNVSAGLGTGPGIQIEVSDVALTLSDITIENNIILDTYGPAIWAICRLNKATNAAVDLSIVGNTFRNCGLSPSISGVGGIVCDGINRVIIKYNMFSGCYGYAVLFGSYIESTPSAGSGYSAEVIDNVFDGQKRGKTTSPGSGAALANLIKNKYTVFAKGNTYQDNYNDLYNVTETPRDPMPEPDHGLDCPVLVKFSCDNHLFEDIRKTISGKSIYKRLEK